MTKAVPVEKVKKELSPLQQRFIDEFLVDLNGTQAARRAGYSEKGAEAQACALLRNPRVSAVIAVRRAKTADKLEVTVERIIAEYAKLGFANMADYITGEGSARSVDLSKLTRDQAAAIQEITVDTIAGAEGDPVVTRTKLKLADKRGSLDSLAKHLGMFVERHQVDVTVEHKSALVDKILDAIRGRAAGPVTIEGVATPGAEPGKGPAGGKP